MAEWDNVREDLCKESTLIMQLLSESLTFWGAARATGQPLEVMLAGELHGEQEAAKASKRMRKGPPTLHGQELWAAPRFI